MAHRDALGFTVTWRPAPAFALPAWPPDLDASVPLDATVFQIERRVEPTGDWVPVLDDDNQTLGDRGGAIRELALTPGTDLATVFPDNAVQTSGTDLDLHFVDSFGVVDEPAAGGEAAPEPGSLHRYRVRTIDSVGRPSANWRETAPVRLEKHVPPPVPVRVDARVLVPDAPDLTADERALLGTSDSAVVLRWEWGQDQRDQDPFASEFRVYAAPPMDTVAGTVTAVTLLSSGQVTSYRVELQLDRAIASDIVAGQRLDAGHPFFIRSHDAGSAIQMVVETRLRPGGVAPVPVTGPVSLALPLTPDRTRPPAWGTRQAVVPIHTDPADTAYEVVLRDLLTVTDAEPVATAWVGVSTADDQALRRRPARSARHSAGQRERDRAGAGHGAVPRPARARDPAAARTRAARCARRSRARNRCTSPSTSRRTCPPPRWPAGGCAPNVSRSPPCSPPAG